jgi:hypothetical protein
MDRLNGDQFMSRRLPDVVPNSDPAWAENAQQREIRLDARNISEAAQQIMELASQPRYSALDMNAALQSLQTRIRLLNMSLTR